MYPFIAEEMTLVITDEDYSAVYLTAYDLPILRPTCNCVEFVKSLGVKGIKTNEPIVGGGIRLKEGKVGHWVYIFAIEENDYLIIESNYVPCKITFRRIAKDYKLIDYFLE